MPAGPHAGPGGKGEIQTCRVRAGLSCAISRPTWGARVEPRLPVGKHAPAGRGRPGFRSLAARNALQQIEVDQSDAARGSPARWLAADRTDWQAQDAARVLRCCKGRERTLRLAPRRWMEPRAGRRPARRVAVASMIDPPGMEQAGVC